MKKLLLSFALAFAALIANGQLLSQSWYSSEVVVAGAGLIPSTNTKGVGSIAYDKTNGNLYLAERAGEIYIINPNNYNAQTGQLNTSAYSSANILKRPVSFNDADRFYKVRVADDGAIYATGMRASANNIHIYRWSSVSDQSPTLTVIALATTPTTGRTGDSFAVYGTGDNTKLYVSSTATSTPTTGQFLHVLSVTGGVPALQISVDLDLAKTSASAMDVAKGSISVESENVIWVKSFQLGVHFKRIVLNLTTGVVSQFKNYSSPSFNYTFGEYFNDGGTGYLLAGSSTTNSAGLGLKMSMNRGSTFGSEPSSFTEFFATLMQGTYTSSNGYGDFATRKNIDGTTTVYFLVNKNGLAAYQSNVPLPVSLTSFNAALLKGQSTLTWETASETNNKGFEVLRSIDGKEFTKIDFVNAKGQNGNSSTALSYTYVDRTAKAGTNYYQLKQVDLDGKTELFKDVKSVNVSLAGGVIVFPNPATTYVSVNAGSADFKGVKYEFFDASGKKVLSEKAKAEQQDISLGKLPASVYYLKISKDNVVQNTVKLIKQ